MMSSSATGGAQDSSWASAQRSCSVHDGLFSNPYGLENSSSLLLKDSDSTLATLLLDKEIVLFCNFTIK